MISTAKKQHKRLPLMWILIICITALTLAILAALWILQVSFLDSFYYSVTRASMKKAGTELAGCSAEELQVHADYTSMDKDFCVLVFDRENGSIIASSELSGSCLIHRLGKHNLSEIYRKAIADGGTSVFSISLDSIKHEQNPDLTDNSRQEPPQETDNARDPLDAQEPASENTPQTGELPKENLDSFSSLRGRFPNFSLERLIYAGVFSNCDGGTRFILLDCPLTPTGTVRSALSLQLAIVAAAAAVLAVLTAFIISTVISRPIKGLSDGAAKLAEGNYSAEFKGGGCREIDDLSSSLTHAGQELSKIDTMQKDLISNISHDLRTPLTMISGYAEIMRDIPGEVNPENLQVIIDETGRMKNLVNDIVSISKLQGDSSPLETEKFALTEALTETVDRFTKLNECKGYRFVLNTVQDPAYVEADRSSILQVLYNLLGNAVNYTGADKNVIVNERIENGQVRVDIIDSGHGIPQEELPNIWNRYYRTKNHKRGVGGAGIGLSIVKTVLEKHGATFGVSSEEGKGSDFWFSLRLSDQ